MTVVDSSAVIDHLMAGETHNEIERHLETGLAAAPDVLVFEVLSVLRGAELGGHLEPVRARQAVEALGDLAVELFPSLELRGRAWALRHNLSTADATFVALAESLGEPLLTRDRRMAAAAQEHTDVETIVVGE